MLRIFTRQAARGVGSPHQTTSIFVALAMTTWHENESPDDVAHWAVCDRPARMARRGTMTARAVADGGHGRPGVRGAFMNDTALLASAVIALGLSGWLLPYRWNLLRLRRSLANSASEKINRLMPKIIGSILIILGAILIVGTYL